MTPPAGKCGADSALFTARAFVISYDTQSMLRGELVATRIIAENPHIHLATDARTGDWNFRRLGEHNEERPAPPFGTRPPRPRCRNCCSGTPASKWMKSRARN